MLAFYFCLQLLGIVTRKMKVIAAYLLAVLGGNTTPTADDIKNILGSGTFYRVFIFFVGFSSMNMFVLYRFMSGLMLYIIHVFLVFILLFLVLILNRFFIYRDLLNIPPNNVCLTGNICVEWWCFLFLFCYLFWRKMNKILIHLLGVTLFVFNVMRVLLNNLEVEVVNWRPYIRLII